ncbi:MAG: hypothetical protein AVDCRST_MAG74-908 [uncultured Pyrinomonadaceae bacterium]|uniref:CHRD domain-containing protein n=1 Tax=uncultured Pyrinomonadaceae bacterium TaxID=2283094 RepID=A0A6J4NJ11_9BACT|nr:MAG: hypothetical protein AVDCRST_MAG74-908 [uncultured Pyrinomonadaceae bacterium]
MTKTVKNRNLLKISAVLMLAFAWAIVPFTVNDTIAEASDISGEVRIGATLTGAAIGGVTPSGFAEHRFEPDGGGERRRLSVQVFSVNLPSGTLLDIYVNNAFVGQIGINSGSGFFNIDTNNGQNVPSVSSGNPIVLRQGAINILTGTFGIVSPSPSPSVSPSGSPSPSVSPTNSPSPSPSISPSVSPSPTVSPSPSPNGGDLFAALNGPTLNGVLPNGFAQYEIHSSRTELEIRVRQINLPPGTALAVLVNNAAVGNLILEGGGEGRLRLRSDNGQTVPVITAGSTIAIRNGVATILSGIFVGGGTTPSPSPSPSVSPTPSQGRYFEAHLTGSRMSPPVATNATGEVKVFLNQNETQATITGEFHNLSSAQTSARIEITVGTTSVVYSFPNIGGTNGNFPNATIPVTAIQVAQLRTGLWSAVIASAGNPNGEIRGQLTSHSNGSDFDGDGSNDISVFRPSAGTWYIQNSQGFSAQILGGANDKLVSGDYDGDGRTDAAVFQNVNGAGVWIIRRSSDGGATTAQFGSAGDTPVRGDFDGDGRSDLAVYRSSNGTWYIQKSSDSGFLGVQFGASEDIPVAADMDGDGKSDIAVFRPSNGAWYWLRSSDGGFGALHFGQSGDIPIAGDFDGDGKADTSVFRPSNGTWYIQRSSNGTYDFRQFGLGTDVPVAGNYDGDNKTDIAVFRPSNGVWYIWRSVDGAFDFRHFGQNGDIPTVNR